MNSTRLVELIKFDSAGVIADLRWLCQSGSSPLH